MERYFTGFNHDVRRGHVALLVEVVIEVVTLMPNDTFAAAVHKELQFQ